MKSTGIEQTSIPVNRASEIQGWLPGPPPPTEIAGISLDVQFVSDPQHVRQGGSIAYTLEITNTGAEKIDPVYVALSLSPYLRYRSGSTFGYWDGEAAFFIADTWLSTGVNLGPLLPGQVGRLVLAADVSEVADPGSLVESVIQLKQTWLPAGSDEWFQIAAQSVVMAP